MAPSTIIDIYSCNVINDAPNVLAMDASAVDLPKAAIVSHQNSNATEEQDKKKGWHATAGHQSVLQSSALYQYMLETSVYPRESSYQKELQEISIPGKCRNLMMMPADEGQFFMLLMKLINAKNTLELGVYTRYSLLSTALALPDDGKIIAIDIHIANYELGVPVIEKAGLVTRLTSKKG
ncbi:hypothetical protein L7F22_069142 [Adiantum nelumboides]|nr:hypothetical protein [Adiantum nelumboides]